MEKDAPTTKQGSTDEAFAKRARESRYDEYLFAFTRSAGGSIAGHGSSSISVESTIACAIAARDAKNNDLRSLAEYEKEVQRLKSTTIETPDASVYGGSDDRVI